MICHDPEDMRNLSLSGYEGDVRKTLFWAADEIALLRTKLAAAERVIEAARSAVKNDLAWDKFDYSSKEPAPESDSVFTKRMQEALASYDSTRSEGEK